MTDTEFNEFIDNLRMLFKDQGEIGHTYWNNIVNELIHKHKHNADLIKQVERLKWSLHEKD